MKQFVFGNTKIVIHSKLASMSPEQQKEWFDKEYKKGNLVLKQIAQVIHE